MGILRFIVNKNKKEILYLGKWDLSAEIEEFSISELFIDFNDLRDIKVPEKDKYFSFCEYWQMEAFLITSEDSLLKAIIAYNLREDAELYPEGLSEKRISNLKKLATAIINFCLNDQIGFITDLSDTELLGFLTKYAGYKEYSVFDDEEDFYGKNKNMDHKNRITPKWINTPEQGHIVIVGTNLAGRHGAGLAKKAFKEWKIRYGQAHGLSNCCYLIPIKDGRHKEDPEVKRSLPLSEIKTYVDTFIEFAKQNDHLIFDVPLIGCGLAGYTAKDIAPLFIKAVEVDNIRLPQEFWDHL